VRRVGIVIWGETIEDWLDPLGVSFDRFCEEMDAGWLFGYVAALASQGIESVILCCSRAAARPLRRLQRPSGAIVRAYPPSRRFGPFSQRRLLEAPPARSPAVRALRAARWHAGPYVTTRAAAFAHGLRAERCDAILCQDYETARFDLMTAVGRALGLPVFATYQGIDVQASRLERLTRPLALRAAAGLLIPARAELERVRRVHGVAQERLAHVFNPVDVDAWRPADRAVARRELGLPEDAEVVVTHGRMDVDDKGLDVLLSAFRAIREAEPSRDRRLLLVGSGGDAPVLREWLASGEHPGVEWVDEFVLDVDRLRTLLSAGDVYAFAGRYEGMPVAPIEGMACGLPLVATDASGVPDLLTGPGAAGGTMVPRDDAAALAAALGEMLGAEPGRRRGLGERARTWVERHCAVPRVGAQLAAFMASRTAASQAGSGSPD
jgi:glycosyltransferase involved in cell wall biosynthesis